MVIPITAYTIKMNKMIMKNRLATTRQTAQRPTAFRMRQQSYSTDSSTAGDILNRLYQMGERTEHKEPHPGLNIASHHFSKPYPLVKEIEKFSLVSMDLLIRFAYPYFSGYAKFTISITMRKEVYGENKGKIFQRKYAA